MKVLKYFFITLFLSIGLNVSAQFSIGVKTGYVKAWQDYGDANIEVPEDATTHVNRMEIALLAYYSLGNRFSIGVEPGFVQRGAACEPGFIQFNADTKLFLNYIEMPFYLSYKMPFLGEKFELLGKLGYGPTMVISGKRELWDIENNTLISEAKIAVNDKERINKWGHAAAGGIGINYILGKSKLFLESRYTYSFGDVIPDETSKNRGLHIDIGFSFSL